jgi:hypothetical protein
MRTASIWSTVGLGTCLGWFAGIANADTNYELAERLAEVIVSKDVCGYVLDEAAIQAAIEKQVTANDWEFPNTLEINISSEKNSLEGLDELQTKLWCQQLTRAGKKRGFIKP